jgi:hypothetical protein
MITTASGASACRLLIVLVPKDAKERYSDETDVKSKTEGA